MPVAPPYPIIVGVTGHRDIAPDEPVRDAVAAVLAALKQEYGDALFVMTALADGADQLVAEAAERCGIPLIAVAPMPRAIYRAKLSEPGKDKFDHHWHRAELKFALPERKRRTAADHDEWHYEQLGALLSRRSHFLLALWDGLSSTARGGTAAVVHIRQYGEHSVAGFRESPLFAGAVSRLDLGHGGPILQIVSPRRSTGGKIAVPGHPSANAGDCYYAHANGVPATHITPGDLVMPGGLIAALPEQAQEDLRKLAELNGKIAGFNAADDIIFDEQVGFLPFPDPQPTGELGEQLERLRGWQASADTAARHFQRRLLGDFVPAWSIFGMLANGGKAAKKLRRPPHAGLLFCFAAAVPLAVLFFSVYAHLGHSPWTLLLYLAIFAGSAALYRLHVGRHNLQEHFQDYRAVAEGMRVQLFWTASGLPSSVSDHYLRKQSGELGWIAFALRGPSLWALAAALSLRLPLYGLVLRGWIGDQLIFYGRPKAQPGRAKLNEHAAQRARLWARCFIYLGLVFSALLFVLEGAKLVAGYRGWALTGIWSGLHETQDWLLVLAATAPAIATFFIVSRNLRAYEAHAHSYALMGRLFALASEQAATARGSEFRDLMLELGREALAENAEWLLDHRHRPIEHQ